MFTLQCTSMIRPCVLAGLLAAAGPTGCTVDSEEPGPFGGATSGAMASSGGDDGEGGEAEVLDIGNGVATGSADPDSSVDSCRKIDFLFVVDSSVSMSDEQESLIASFPGFGETIRSTTSVTDYNVMIVDTDAYAVSPEFEWANCTPQGDCCAPWCAEQVDNPVSVCNGYPCTMPASCEDRLGSGKAQDLYGEACGVGGDRQFISSQTDGLDPSFSCIARVGTTGYIDEKPMEALTLALSDEMTADGGCNAEFLRDDALLVIVVITDEDDDAEAAIPDCARAYLGSAGDPQTWFDAVAAAKGGIEKDIVVLSVVGPTDGSCPELDKCQGGVTGAEPATRITEFTEKFTNGSLGSVCAPSYDDFFLDAVDIVAQACLDFEPVP